MTEPNPPRRRLLYAGAAAAVALVVVVVVVALAAGGDDGGDADGGDGAVGVVASTAPAAGTGAPGSTTATTTAPDDAGGSPAPSAAPTLPSEQPPTTTASGSDTGDGGSGAAGTTTTVATPAPGSLVTVPTGTVPVADPIPPDEVGEFGTGVTAEIVSMEAVDGVAQLPGEVSGPAVRVTVRLTNGSDGVVNLSRVLVDVSYGADRTPGLALGEPGAEPFIGELAAGSTAEGIYVFGVPIEARDRVQISVAYDVTAPILVFEGPAPTR